MNLNWALRQNARTLQEGVVPLKAKAREKETVSIPVLLPADVADDVFILDLRCLDETGRSFYERSIRLNTVAEGGRGLRLLKSLPEAESNLEVSDADISVVHPLFRLKLDRASGACSVLGADGGALVSAIGPHAGRVLTINDLGKQREGETRIWRGELLSKVTGLKTAARKTSEGALITVSGSYPRPGFSEQALEGEYRLLIRNSGALEVSYQYVPVRAAGAFVEAGLALAVPAAQSEFHWLGQGPYAGYPGKDRLNEFGLFHLNREDQYFPGNRRKVELAFLASPSGSGVLLAGTNMTVSLDYEKDVTIFSHVALVPGQGSGASSNGENIENKSEVKAESVKRIAGRFTLLPLNSTWPDRLTNWFGSPAEKVAVNKRYYHSYDQ
jgi:beta-galactosidase